MENDPPPSEAPSHAHSQVRVRKVKMRIRLRRSQLQAIFICAKRLNIGTSTFMRTSAMRKAFQDKPSVDPSMDVNLWVSPDEKKRIDEAAARLHSAPSTFVRESSISAVADIISRPVPQPPSSLPQNFPRVSKPEAGFHRPTRPGENGGIGKVR